jgi:hypothetical protein
MAISLAGWGVFLLAGQINAQVVPSQNRPEQAPAIHFHRDPVGPATIGSPGAPASTDQIQPFGQPGDLQPIPKLPYAEESMALRGVREVPGLERLTQLESQAELYERMKQEALRSGDRITFPEEPVLAKEPYPGRVWAPKVEQAEPAWVAHPRLLFEQKNFERGLWDFGVLTPVVETGLFYFDVAALPYHLATRPCQQYDTSAGKCLPGDPAPFYLYPPELSFSGAVAEVAVVTAVFFIFP